jgi:hypothetical protein
LKVRGNLENDAEGMVWLELGMHILSQHATQ